MWCGCCGRVDTCLGSFVLLLSYGLFIFLNTDNCYSLFLRFIKTHKSFLGTKDIFPPPPPPPHKSYYYTNEESIQTKLLEHSLFWQQPIESPHAMLLWEPARKLMTVSLIWFCMYSMNGLAALSHICVWDFHEAWVYGEL